MSDANIKKLFKTAFEAAQDVKAEEVTGVNLTKISSYADYVLIASGTSGRQVQSIADRILDDAHKKCGIHPLGVEGYENGLWILVDFGDIICHVFLNELRPNYRLEHMWPRAVPMNETDLGEFFSGKKKLPVMKIKKVAAAKKKGTVAAKKAVIVRRVKKKA